MNTIDDRLIDIPYFNDVVFGSCNNMDVTEFKNSTSHKNANIAPIIIEKATLLIHTLDSCYAHAVECAFKFFWAISDIKIKYPQFTEFVLLVSKQWPSKSIQIDVIKKEYTGIWKSLSETIGRPPVILFEELLDRPYIFKHLFKYIHHDNWQRSFWNCVTHYPSRSVQPKYVRFSDDLIYEKLNMYRNYVFSCLVLPLPRQIDNSLIIIERRSNRKFDNHVLNNIINEAKTNKKWIFKGIYYLEDMTLKDQVELFSKTHIFIFRHGACIINLVWNHNNSIVFDIGGGPDGVNEPYITGRLCKLTESKHIYLDYNRLNISQIFDVL